MIAESVITIALTRGPFVGHVTDDSALIWARAGKPATFILRGDGIEATAEATREHDLTMVFRIDGLTPATTYHYRIRQADETVFGPECSFTTAPSDDDPSAVVSLVFGSCADASKGAQDTWRRIGDLAPDAIVLLGDTPYIDTTDLAFQRMRYRMFARIPALDAVLRTTSWYGTWDDHDFGRNDTDGNLPGKEHARRAFIEYHANPSYGDGEHGIYTSFRRGAVEVFLLDTRWFAATGPSPADADAPTLLGTRQWQWLLDGLERSDAPFKVLACGMIWNGATRPNKPDHWERYRAERDALFTRMGREGITGVVLVGGDIHRSRVIRHATAPTAGYALTELITSPMHDGIIDAANAPHPGLVWDAGAPNTFLLLRVSGDTLVAEFHDASGTILHSETLSTDGLRKAHRKAEPTGQAG